MRIVKWLVGAGLLASATGCIEVNGLPNTSMGGYPTGYGYPGNGYYGQPSTGGLLSSLFGQPSYYQPSYPPGYYQPAPQYVPVPVAQPQPSYYPTNRGQANWGQTNGGRSSWARRDRNNNGVADWRERDRNGDGIPDYQQRRGRSG
jgi:hypothetical protein